MASDCVFCRIVSGDIPAKIVYRDDQVVAFHDAHPQAPVHVLIVPSRHIESLAAAQPEDEGVLGHMMAIAPKVAALTGIDRGGYRLVLNTGRDAGLAVYHLHLHVMGGRRMGWPPG